MWVFIRVNICVCTQGFVCTRLACILAQHLVKTSVQKHTLTYTHRSGRVMGTKTWLQFEERRGERAREENMRKQETDSKQDVKH